MTRMESRLSASPHGIGQAGSRYKRSRRHPLNNPTTPPTQGMPPTHPPPCPPPRPGAPAGAGTTAAAASGPVGAGGSSATCRTRRAAGSLSATCGSRGEHCHVSHTACSLSLYSPPASYLPFNPYPPRLAAPTAATPYSRQLLPARTASYLHAEHPMPTPKATAELSHGHPRASTPRHPHRLRGPDRCHVPAPNPTQHTCHATPLTHPCILPSLNGSHACTASPRHAYSPV